MTDQETKDNVIEKAIRYGVPRKHSCLFDQLEEGFKIRFNQLIQERNFGLPIVQFSHSNGFWVIIGTKELAWYDTSETRFLDLKEIKSFESLDREEARLKEPNPMLQKFQLEQLGIITKDEQLIKLYLEKKEEYYTFWHMMIRILKII